MSPCIDSAIHSNLCLHFNRRCLLCAKCAQGYGVPCCTFSLHCVPRQNVTLWRNVLKYVAIGYGPLTVFFIFIVMFTVSVNSAPLHGLIFVCQIIASRRVLITVVGLLLLKPSQIQMKMRTIITSSES